MAITIINPIVNLFADMEGGSGTSGGIGKNTCILSYNVAEVPNYAFKDNRYLSGMSLAKNMESIGVQAFINCINLETVIIPKSVGVIYSKAFANCKLLSKVIFEGDPATMTIEEDAFKGCSSLSWFTEEDTVGFKNIGGSYYLSDKGSLGDITKVLSTEGEWLYCGHDYVNVPDYAYKNAIGLTNAYIKNNTEIIGIEAYNNCSALQQVTIPASVKTIKKLAFKDCSALSSVVFSGDPTLIDIAYDAFNGCTSLSFFIDENDDFCKKIGKVFHYLNDKGEESIAHPAPAINGTWVYFRDYESYIADYKYKDAIGLTETYLHDNVKTIGIGAYFNCQALTTVVIPSSVRLIKSKAFGNCPLLTEVLFEGDLSKIVIADDAFSGSPGFSWFTDNVEIGKNIGGAFYLSDKATGHIKTIQVWEANQVYFKNNYANIPDRAYKHAVGLTEAELKIDTQFIGEEAYLGCTGLTTLGIPGNVQEIKDRAFKDCSNISIVIINQSGALKRIGEEAVAYCTNLEYINIPLDIEYMAKNAFVGCSKLSFFDGSEAIHYKTILGFVYLSDKGNGTHIIINDTEVNIK